MLVHGRRAGTKVIDMSAREPFRSDPDYIRERRHIVRTHHPDSGGSDEALIRALDELDATWRRKTGSNPKLRAAMEDSMPGFVPDHLRDETLEAAMAYAQRLQDGAELLRRQGQKLRKRGTQAAQSPTAKKLRDSAGKAAEKGVRQAGRLAGKAADYLNRKFPKEELD